MTRSHPHKERSGSNIHVSQGDFLEGTSARTRPLSFDDIMLRRKNRGDTSKQVTSGPEAADFALAQQNIEKDFEYPELHRQINEDSEPMEMRHTSHDSKKESSRRKGDTSASRKNGKLIQDKEERSIDPDAKSKGIVGKNVSSRKTTEGKHERRDHSNRKKDGPLTVDSDNGSKKRQARDSYNKERVPEGSRLKSEINRKSHNEDRQVYRKRKTDGWMSSDSENEYKKRNARDVIQTDKLTDRSREKSDKDIRHKRHNEEDKTRGRSTGKKNDSDKKGQESTQVYLEESRPKRRRSRSREQHDKGRSRRSLSHSPKGHKHTSDKREHGELSSHSIKDRSVREQSDVDQKRISSNGSSSHYRRNAGPSSGLGGYSPRKRKTEAAAKTPSPTHRSPERKSAGWDLQPVEKESNMADLTLSNVPTTSQNLSLNIKEFPSGTPVTPMIVKPIGISHHTLSSQIHAIESIQLTQATRPMRRLYVENLPASASEKDLIECINKFLLSSGVNYIQGTQPCISCIIHKEKSQALLEFLTPEDASAALSLDGMSFSGSNLKFRRPKDYTSVATGLSDKSVVSVDSITDIVEDSPHKIFIGGISKLISSKMLLEIARTFGPVKAFHFECIADINEPCAFLEYADHSVTSKACAGLNGMKLGGQVVTAVFATPEAALENVGLMPLYGIPKHAKPLLKNPTAVLKLKNAVDPEGLLSMSESEIEEILEDIRLESSRFGTVKSINIAKPTNSLGTSDVYEVKNTSASTDVSDLELANRSYITEELGKGNNRVGELDRTEPPETLKELEDNNLAMEDNNGYDNNAAISKLLSKSVEPEDINTSKVVSDCLSDEMIAGNLMKDAIFKPPSNDENISVKDTSNQENSGGLTGEFADKRNSSVIEFTSNENVTGSISVRNIDEENIHLIEEELKSKENSAKRVSSEEELKLQENNANIVTSVKLDSDERKELEALEEGNKENVLIDLGDVFEPGSVFVEYRRAEAACMAAHCLHGRIFDGRVVTVGYVGHDLYHMRFRR